MENLYLATFNGIMSYVFYIVIAILVLLVMITVHEFGHFITGKILGFGIQEFSIGFGPKIFGRKNDKTGEEFSIRVLPLGGYCAFRGEDEEDSDPTAFNNKKTWQRLIVLVSGALMNYIIAVMLIAVMFGSYGFTALYVNKTEEDRGVKQENLIQDKDVLLKINGKSIYLVSDVMEAINGKKQGESINAVVLRGGKMQNIEVTLLEDADFNNIEDVATFYKVFGIKESYKTTDINGNETTAYGLYTTGVKLGFFKTVGRSFEYSLKIASTVFTVFRQLLTGSLGVKSLGGTVTTITTTADTIRTNGLWGLLNIASFIGVNLAVFNLLPIPALDGSRALFTVIEWITKKPINKRVEGMIHTVGFIALLLFAVFVDLQRCF